MWIFVSFKINQEKIAETLCVQKEVKNNTCQGQCHLRKQLDKAEEEEKKQAPSSQKDKYEVLYCYSSKLFDFLRTPQIYTTNAKVVYHTDFSLSTFISDIFHPPKLNLI